MPMQHYVGGFPIPHSSHHPSKANEFRPPLYTRITDDNIMDQIPANDCQMDPIVKTKWTARLKSGEYLLRSNTKFHLRCVDNDGVTYWDPMGVLVDVIAPSIWKGPKINPQRNYFDSELLLQFQEGLVDTYISYLEYSFCTVPIDVLKPLGLTNTIQFQIQGFIDKGCSMSAVAEWIDFNL